MCTAICLNGCAGRNLDIEKGYSDALIITPRKYVLPFRKTDNIEEHFAFIGVGTVSRGYPLYYDAANEHGLYMAGLNYVGNAKYHAPKDEQVNLAPYELVPYILSTCKDTYDAEHRLRKINLVDIPFSRELPSAELHFIVADKNRALTVEPDAGGLNIYENKLGVLANNPSFPIQMHNLNNYASLTNEPIKNHFPDSISFNEYSKGMGALGLPGDLSSESRFVRAAFHKLNYVENGDITDIFHLLSTVAMPRGSIKLGDEYEITAYTSAVNLASLVYYYKTYGSVSLCSASLFNENLSSPSLVSYPLITLNDVSSHN
jgi:choloylglycine hydrolase